MKALLDLDGVLVDFLRGALEIHNLNYDPESFYADKLGNWNFAESLGMSAPAFWKPMDEEFWAKLEWMPDGEQILAMVEKRFGRENVIVASSPSSNFGCYDGKKRWMERHLPRHYSRSKGHVIGSLKHLMSNPRHVLIDDRDENLHEFATYAGGLVCEVPRLWNRRHPDRHRTLEIIGEQLGL